MGRIAIRFDKDAYAEFHWHRQARSCGVVREREHLAQRPVAAGEHDKSIESDRDPRASRQSRLMGREQSVVHFRRRSSCLASRRDITLHSPMQFDGIPELMIAIGDFDAVDIQLEPLRNLRGTHANLCKCRLRRRKIKQVDSSGPECRLHCAGKEIVETVIAGGGCRTACESTRLTGIVKFRRLRGKWIEVEMTRERLSERDAPGRSRTENSVEQCVDIVYEEVVVESDPIPFENRELQVVEPATFAVAECAGDLVDRSASRRQQSLHREFRRCLKIPGAARSIVSSDTLNRRIGDRAGTQDRGLDLQDAPGVEVRTHRTQHPSPQSKRVDTRTRAPVAT